MAAARTFLRKYWILIVIVLWVIAWANRDWLAGQAPAGEDAYAEEAPIEVPPARRDVAADAVAAAAEPAPPAPETPTPEPVPTPEPAAPPPEAGMSAVPPPDPAPIAPERETAAGAEAEPAVPIPAAPVTEPVVEREEAVAPAAVAEATELLSRARSVARSRGPGAAAAVLAAGLRELPDDAPERADLYGEMGNYHFTAGNFTAALAAYDSALRALPEEERVAMLRRLAPIYDRYHPAGRSHLEQFR
jgi:tetratricopeptide (TPR) repeat protein